MNTSSDVQEALRTVAAATHEAVISVDEFGVITLFNHAAEELFGRKKEEMLGRPFSGLLPEDCRDRHVEFVKTCLATNQPDGAVGRRIELLGLRSDGDVFPMDVSVSPGRVGDKQFVVAVARDISKRRHTEERIERIERLNHLKEDLLAPGTLHEKLRRVTDAVVRAFDADFARIWVTQPADLCDAGCFHATVTEGPHVCRERDRCLHLIASSGRYTHVDGELHSRVPFGCYKIGRIAAEEESKFVTNEVTHDPRVHDPEWARALGLVSFAGYRLLSAKRKPIGVLALFSQHPCTPDDDALLETVATTASQVIQTAMAEEALRRGEELLRTVVNATQDAMISIGEDGLITLFNPAAEQMFGRNRDEMLGRPLGCLMPEGYRERHAEYLKSYFATGNPSGALGRILELPGLRSDGVVFPMAISLSSGKRDGERFVVAVARDITDRKQAEQALRDSEEKWRSLVENAPNFIMIVEHDGTIQLINRATPDTTVEDVIGRSIYDYLLPEDHPVVKKTIAQVFQTEMPGSYEARVKLMGQVVWFANQVGPIKRDGRVAAVMLIATDITDRKRTEVALRRSTEELAALADEQKFILDNMRDFVYRHDSKGVFYYLSPAVEHVTGYTVEEWENHYTTYMTDNPVNEKVIECTERTLRSGETNPPYLVELHHKNGSRITLEVSERPYYENGRVAGIIGVARDITERKRAEEERRALEAQMQHAQKLESLGVLAGGIAHDFNNLLVGILGNASLALNRSAPESPARRAIEQIEQAAQRAADLTRQMLAYSGKGAFVVEPVNLSKLVEEMAHLLEAVTSKKAVLKYDFPEKLPLIEVDATQVRQVVMNLITNASEAISDTSGVIAVRTGVMEADREYLAEAWSDEDLPAGTYTFIEVTDTGCGMVEEARAKLFDPFFTTKFTGRGLGLAAVLGIVRGHRGAIKIQSKPARGSTFRVLFPASEGLAEPVPKEPPPSEGPSRTGVIFVVDDEELVRTTTKLALEDMGFTVLTASDGREALDVFQAHRNEIDIVLLDLTMPQLGGEEVLHEMRLLQSSVRVILSSGYSEQEAMARIGGACQAGFLQKPYRIATLAEKLREMLGS